MSYTGNYSEYLSYPCNVGKYAPIDMWMASIHDEDSDTVINMKTVTEK